MLRRSSMHLPGPCTSGRSGQACDCDYCYVKRPPRPPHQPSPAGSSAPGCLGCFALADLVVLVILVVIGSGGHPFSSTP
jgi:hypothetical protein